MRKMNIDNYCRLCALPGFKLLQIFDDEGFKLNIVDSINKCLKIEICEEDHLPRAVCLECSEKLTSTCKFIDASFEAQETLHRILEETYCLKEEKDPSFDSSFGDGSKFSTNSLVSVLEQGNKVSEKTLITIDDVDSSLIEEYVENLNTRNDDCLSNDHNFFSNQIEKPGDEVSCKELPRRFSMFSDAKSNISSSEISSFTKTDSNIYQAVSQVDTALEIFRINNNSKDTCSRETIKINKGVFDTDSAKNKPHEREVIEVTDESESGSRVEHEEANTDSSTSKESKTVIEVKEVKCSSKRKERKEVERAKAICFDNTSWPCAQCDYSCTKYDDLRSHYSSVHGVPVKYMCPVCSKHFIKSTNFYAHLKKHRPTFDSDQLISTKSKDSSDESSYENPDKKLPNISMMVHEDNHPLHCDECGKSFRHQSLLQLHARCHLPVDVKNKFQCDLCDKRFSTKPNLITHRRIHLGVRNYTCDQCGKSFVQKGNLDAHLLTHSSDKPFVCDICNRSFKTMLQLRKHHSVHTGAKPHQCDVCGRMFRERGTLREHYRIHTGAMPFSCEFCGKSFRFKGILTTHRRQHTGEKPYSCLECQHHFTNWPNYNKHMKRRHGINMSKTSRVKTDPAVSADSPSKTMSMETESLKFQTQDITEHEPYDQCIDSLAVDHILSNASNFYNVSSSSSFNASSYAHPFLNSGPLLNFYNLSHLATSVPPMDAMGFGQNMIDVMASAHPQLR